MLEGFVPFPEEFVRKYRQKGLWVDRTIGEELDGAVATHSDRVALACGGERITFRELGEKATRLALHFIDLGLKPQDRIILQLPNEPEFAYCFYAAVKIGLIPIMSLPAHREAEISFFAQFTHARAHTTPALYKGFSHQAMSRNVRKKAPDMALQFVSGAPVEEGFISLAELLDDKIEERISPESLKEYRPDPLEPALFQLSGGTTGVPKIIPRTHNDYSLNFKAMARICGLTEASVTGIAIPVNHNFALACPGLLRHSLRRGQGRPHPQHQNGSGFGGDPGGEDHHHADPARPPHSVDGVSRPSRLRPLVPPIRDSRWRKAQCRSGEEDYAGPRIQVFKIWVWRKEWVLEPYRGSGRDASQLAGGSPVDEDEVRVVDKSERDVPYGEPGELLVRGPITIRGYYNSPEYNKKAFTEDGFYRTGDVVRMYKGRYLSVEGRIKDDRRVRRR